jgi:ubiquinone/menaquinone biosynthesis C-methylase UbiE
MPRMQPIESELLNFYKDGSEEHRLERSVGRLERIRTWEIVERHLPPPPARILDVGGATGVYALPLAQRGYEVHLVDAVPEQVARARTLSNSSDKPLAGALVGDARALRFPDRSFDVVLLLGPLYHLIDRADRVTALTEARRVLVSGGVLVAACISRFASAADGMQDGMLRNDAFAAIVDADLAGGVHRNTSRRPEWFTTAYFHRPEEIRQELQEAGLECDHVLGVEGLGWVTRDLDAWLDDAMLRDRLLGILRRLEAEPTLLGASHHLLAIAIRRE